MNTTKLTILTDTFEKQFSIDRFKKFTREFFNGPEMLPETRHTGIWREYDNYIKSYFTIAKYTDSENNNLIVLAVELKKASSIDRARSMQRNFISKVLDENKLEAAIVAFYTENDPSWRLSLVRLDYSFKETGISLDLTPARRYSYLLGENEPNNTAQAQLLPIFENDKHNPTLDEIENAFSVEKVTKDFYSLYEQKYFKLKKYLDEDPDFISESKKLGFEVAKFSEQFAKKLMGQLAFLYFLQKKGWLGVRIMPEDHTLSEAEYRKIYIVQDQAHKNVLDKVFKTNKDKSRKLSASALFSIDDHYAGLLSDCFIKTDYDKPWGSGNRTFIREIFDFCTKNTTKNFFDDYLEPLFYEALNTKRKNQYFKTFNCKIPFLNGGLFEPLEGYHWRDVDFEIPNDIFSNKAKKDREADGILDIFDRFNFTINEDEPLEKEVAVDPEMLGKIFENLLDVSDRKSKGAFYTPREIVHYMCQESLINYLVNEVSVPYEDMKEFILYGELIRDADSRSQVGFCRDFTIKQSIYDNIVKIDEALKNVKVADPAVGSGAFPLGMLNEIVKARNNITEYIIRKDKEGIFNRKFGEDFIRKWRDPYKMKWETIKNSIFAVDIEPSAVDIAKLRLWLSVVVEQEINAENPEPHPLPNLDMNILVGNSLIDEYEGIKLFDKSILNKRNNGDSKNNKKTSTDMIQMSLLIDHTDEILNEMFALQDRYFDEENDERKKEIKGKIDRIRDELIRYKLQKDNNTDALKRYEESLKNKTKPYFIWEMEFAKIIKDKGGFDIVIGNPPYIGERKNKKVFAEVQKGSFNKYYLGRMDYFYFFFHLGLDLLKNNGICSYITTNYYLTALGGKTLRTDLKNRSSISEIINFNEGKVFNSAAGQHNMITTLIKGNVDCAARIKISSKAGNLNSNDIISILLSDKDNDVHDYKIEQNDLWDGEENYLRLTGINNTENPINIVLDKIKVLSTDLLGNICTPLIGLESSLDEVYVLSKDKIIEITKNSHEELKYVKPLFKNSDIDRYYMNENSSKFILYLHENIKDIKSLPGIYSYLLENESAIKSRKGANLRGAYRRGNWWVLNTPRLDMDFEDEKIVTPYRSKTLRFALSTNAWYASRDVYYIVKNKNNISLKYILALLNSKLYFHWFYNRGKRKGDILELYAKPLKEVPIMEISEKQQRPFIEIVDQIIYKRKNKMDTTDLEREVDYMVYHLYGLTDEEICIVEEG